VPPATPTSLALASTTANPVVLSWGAVADAAGYRVWRDGTLLATLTGTAPTGYTDGSVTAGGTYGYTVEAYAGGGTSARTGTVTAIPGGYAATVAAPGGLLGYWRLGEPAGATTLTDSSGNGRNATRLGSTPLGQPSLLTVDPGNTSMTVDGTGNQGATVPSDATLNSLTALSIDMWIKTPASMGQQWRGLFDKDGTPPPTGTMYNRDYDLFAGSADNVKVTKLCFSGGPFGETTWTLATPLAPSTVHHVVVTANTAGAQHLYIDAADQGTVALSWAPRAQAISSAPLRLGMGDNNYWNGGVDDIALYGKVLTPAQVASQYAVGTHTP
jgi:hypothetical protein